MFDLVKKELSLCMHPTAFIFLSFAVLVFVPNYPYEVIFFFSCLSVFFCCMMARENGDIAFSCALPVKKEHIPLAKMLVVIGLQCAILLLYTSRKNTRYDWVAVYNFIACGNYRRSQRSSFARGAVC